MKNKIYLGIFILLLVLPMLYAYDPHQQNKNYTYSETVANADNCNLTSITYPDGSVETFDVEMLKNGFEFNYNISGGNFTQLGNVCWGIVCYDSNASPEYTSGSKCLEVTPSGIKPDIPNALANIIVIFFFIFLIVVMFLINKKIDYEKWYSSIIKKYENKNYIKLVLSSISYNILKNTFVIYYLLGFPLILSLMNLVYVFGVIESLDIIKAFLIIYSIGAIIIGILFLGYAQEWIMNLLNKIGDMNWGVENDM